LNAYKTIHLIDNDVVVNDDYEDEYIEKCKITTQMMNTIFGLNNLKKMTIQEKLPKDKLPLVKRLERISLVGHL
jgi:hypothetical protein